MFEKEKNFVCPICDRAFAKKSGLQQHITKTHPTEKIDLKIDANNKRSQSSQHNQLPPRCPCASQLQILTHQTASTVNSVHRFDIVENDGGGDCLFLSISDYLQRQEQLFPNTPTKAQDVRTAAVNHITSSINTTQQSNFHRFKDSLAENLRNHVPSLKNCAVGSERLTAAEYADYMSTPGRQGTTAELCALAEIFNFGFYVVQKVNEDDYSIYDYGSTVKFTSQGIEAAAFLLFTGSAGNGHFRLLIPDKDSTSTVIPTGAYTRVENYSSTLITSICPVASISNFFVEPPPDNASDPDSEAPNPTVSPNAVEDANFGQMKDLLVFAQTLRARSAVLKIVPKAARIQTAIEFTRLVAACSQPNSDFMAWVHLFTFAYIAFKSPDRKNKTTKSLSIATIVKRNLDWWAKLKRLPLREFSDNILVNLPPRRKSKTAKDAEAIRIKLVPAKLSEGDISGAIRILSSNDTIAAVNMETYEKLREKHPESTINIGVENDTPVEIQAVSATEVRNLLFYYFQSDKLLSF